MNFHPVVSCLFRKGYSTQIGIQEVLLVERLNQKRKTRKFTFPF